MVVAGWPVVVVATGCVSVVACALSVCAACQLLRRTTAVPLYDERFSGTPRSSYSPLRFRRSDDSRRTVVDHADPRGRVLRDDGVGGVTLHGALDSPGEARVLEDSLGEDVGLPADVRDDEDLRARPAQPAAGAAGCDVCGPPAASVQLAAASSQITMSAIRRGASMPSRDATTPQSAATGQRSSPYPV